ncbi:hypothetical protein CBS11350_972 [Aspergillus niger]|nr:hypothetical protein CBS11350_972 [Aspergillus niger]KAI2972353.1 hypothetical protein CBS147324_4556 [Aspergillus niger]
MPFFNSLTTSYDLSALYVLLPVSSPHHNNIVLQSFAVLAEVPLPVLETFWPRNCAYQGLVLGVATADDGRSLILGHTSRIPLLCGEMHNNRPPLTTRFFWTRELLSCAFPPRNSYSQEAGP